MRLPGLSKNLISQSEGQNISSVHLFEAGSQAEEKIFLKNKIQSLLDN